MAISQTRLAQLRRLRLAALVTDGFEQVELKGPRKILEDAGATVELVAPRPWTVQGVNHDRPGASFPIALTVHFADPEDYDGLLVPGGAASTQALQWEPAALDFLRAMDRARRPIAVIGDGARLLLAAGLIAGRALASHPKLREAIEAADGSWCDVPVLRDRHWLSARGPSDLVAFNCNLLDLLDLPRVSTRPARMGNAAAA